MKVVVVGAGAAGTAAAWAARRSGAEVVVVHDRAGASALASGAVDWDAWERASPPREYEPDTLELARELGFALGQSVLATAAGVVRAAAGHDRALLDLTSLAGSTVAVADVTRDDWDAVLLAGALTHSLWARETRTRFVARSVAIDGVEHASSWDLAARFDDVEAQGTLSRELAKGRGEVAAWLLGPWLGTRPGVAEALRQRVELPLGETLSAPGGAAGARFEAARDELFARAGVEVLRRTVTLVEGESEPLRVHFEDGDPLVADRVVLALGGVLAGGIRLHTSRSHFELSLKAPVVLQVDGQSMDAESTLHGVDLAAHGAELLEHVGIACEGAGARGATALFVAGDVMADRPRTWLRALVSGLSAGRAAGR